MMSFKKQFNKYLALAKSERNGHDAINAAIAEMEISSEAEIPACFNEAAKLLSSLRKNARKEAEDAAMNTKTGSRLDVQILNKKFIESVQDTVLSLGGKCVYGTLKVVVFLPSKSVYEFVFNDQTFLDDPIEYRVLQVLDDIPDFDAAPSVDEYHRRVEERRAAFLRDQEDTEYL